MKSSQSFAFRDAELIKPIKFHLLAIIEEDSADLWSDPQHTSNTVSSTHSRYLTKTWALPTPGKQVRWTAAMRIAVGCDVRE